MGDELALYNKLGDLYLKRGDVASAVEQYEAAVNHYAEQGFPNNAIALCNKVLRNAPGRTHIYLKLAKLMMQRGFVSEAKQNLLEYADRMQKAGQIEDAFHALKEFADLSPDNEEIRLLLAEQLKNAARTDEAREQLAKLYQELQEAGDTRRARKTLERMRAIDPDYEVGDDTPAPQQTNKKQKSSDIVFIDLDEGQTSSSVGTQEKQAEAPGQPLVVEPTSFGEGAGLDSVSSGSDLELERVKEDVAVDPDAADVVQLDDLDIGETFATGPEVEIESLDVQSTVLDGSLDVEAPGDDELGVDDRPADVGVSEEVEIEELEGFEAVDDGFPVDEWAGGETVEDATAQSGRESDLHVIGADAIEAGVEVPELDVEGFEGVSGLEDEEGDLPADLPFLDADGVAEGVSGAETAVAEDDEEAVTTAEIEDEEEEEAIDIEADEAGISSTAVVTEPSVGPGTHAAPPYVAELEAQILDDPADPDPHRRLGEALIELGERERGLEELDIALSSYEAINDWQHAQSVADEILRVEPNSVHYHQKRVEYSFRVNDRTALAAAYLELADALVRSGLIERAQVVYRRVLEHDPASERAKSALATLMPDDTDAGTAAEQAPPATGLAQPSRASTTTDAAPAVESTRRPPAESFVDLGALILEEDQVRDTRMRIQTDEPTGDEERDFQDMLSEFKKGIDANIDIDDSQAHYDLGVAFREMGLLDEAISEFQKALRGREGRLRTAEALGLCFYDKGQFAVAGTVLRRAVDSEPGGDDEKIGLLYWLGRCEEEQGHNSGALAYYQRIFSIDIGFQDVRERVKNLAQASG